MLFLSSIYILGLCIMHQPLYLGKYRPSTNMSKVGIDPNNNSCIQRFSCFEIPILYEYVIGITNLIASGGFFNTAIGLYY